MAEGIRHRFTQRRGRVQGIIHSFKEIRDDATRNGEVVAEEALCALKKIERVPNFLAVVQKLLLVGSSEPC